MGLLGGRPDLEKLVKKEDYKRAVKALQHKDAAVRRDAARALGQIVDPAKFRKLLTMHMGLASLAAGGIDQPLDQTAHRVASQLIIGKVPPLVDQSMADALVATLTDQDWEVRQASAVTLGKLSQSRREVGSGGGGLRGISSWGLPELDDLAKSLDGGRGVEELITVLSDRQEAVRKAAAEALQEAGDVRAVQQLSATAERDNSPDVRESAKRAIAMIGQRGSASAGPDGH